MKFTTPKNYDSSQYGGTKTEKPTSSPEPEPETAEPAEPSYSGSDPDELREAIEDYQKWCSENYDELELDLDGIPVEVSHKLKKTAGKAAWRKGKDEVKYIRYAFKAYDKWGWDEFAKTIRHELIHVHTVQNYQKGGHGRLFKTLVEPLDTHRHCESFAEDEAKYVLYCSECDKVVAHRHRKSKTVKNPDKYRSKCCNERLRVEKNK